MIHFHCKPSKKQVKVSNLYNHEMFYHEIYIPRVTMQTDIQYKFPLKLSYAQDSWICKFWLVHLVFLQFFTLFFDQRHEVKVEINAVPIKFLIIVFPNLEEPVFTLKFSHLCFIFIKWHLSWFSFMLLPSTIQFHKSFNT